MEPEGELDWYVKYGALQKLKRWAADEEFFRDHYPALAEAAVSISAAHERYKRASLVNIAVVSNAALFSVLFTIDIRCLMHEIEVRRGTWFAKLHSRHLVLTLYEALEDLQHILGKDFRAVVAQWDKSGDLEKDLRKVLRDLATLYDRERAFLKEIRLAVVGHRDHEASEQMRVLKGIDVERVLRVGYETVVWLNDFLRLTTRCIAANPLRR